MSFSVVGADDNLNCEALIYNGDAYAVWLHFLNSVIHIWDVPAPFFSFPITIPEPELCISILYRCVLQNVYIILLTAVYL